MYNFPDENEVIELYSELLPALKQLNEDAPVIKKMYEDASNTAERQRLEFANVSTKIDKELKQLSNHADSESAKISELTTNSLSTLQITAETKLQEISRAADKLTALLEQAQAAIKSMEEQYKQYQELQSKFVSMATQKSKKDSNPSNFTMSFIDKFIESLNNNNNDGNLAHAKDGRQLASDSIGGLYNKYYRNFASIKIHRTSWTDNYYGVIVGLSDDNTCVSVNCFSNGTFRKANSYAAESTSFTLYQ